jgi:site-specific recombinase XerD
MHSPTIADLVPNFLDYMTAERRFSTATIEKYHSNIFSFLRDVGDLPIGDLRLEHFITLKAAFYKRGAGHARVASIIFAMKCLLTYARDVLGVQILDLKNIRAPREQRREVSYLTQEELERFVSAIPLETTWTQQPRVVGYCFRSLVEALLASGMRISEALGMDRNSIDFEKREAVIIGKGNRQRAVFFTERAVGWIRRYLELRRDSNPALFATSTGQRLRIGSVEAAFRRTARWGHLEKHVTPHVLRHTAATTLLKNGCPIGYIKEVLGHQRLETTCHYYLGILGKDDTKKAFDEYMRYGEENNNLPEAPMPTLSAQT